MGVARPFHAAAIAILSTLVRKGETGARIVATIPVVERLPDSHSLQDCVVNDLPVPDIKSALGLLEDNIASVVLGKRNVARKCLVALLAGEHVLLEDVPGVGKTLMGKALARSVDSEFRRLQFTPDLLPSDITGSSIFDRSTNRFEFHRGPIFGNIILADEINRAPPRTQSALLEPMGEGNVTVDGITHELPQPFMVIATQNPFEFEGTYLLPESQLDRFLLRVSMGYPDREFENDIIRSHRKGEPVDQLPAVVTREQIAQLKLQVRDVTIDNSICRYMLDIIHATRESPELAVGVSTRGLLLWTRATQAQALLEGRNYVVPDDAKGLAIAVLAHRVIGRGSYQGGDRTAMEAVIRQIVETTVIN